jgi:hypothetical protein
MAYILTPDINIVITANVAALTPLAPGPNRSCKYPGTEWVFEM